MRYILLLLLLLTSCTTPSKPVPVPTTDCPPPVLIDTNAADPQVGVSERRCRQLYPPNGCLSELRRVGELRYVAKCKREGI